MGPRRPCMQSHGAVLTVDALPFSISFVHLMANSTITQRTKSTSNILDLNSLTNNDYSQLVPCSLVFFNARFVSLIIETMLFDACLASTLVTKKCSHRCAAQIPISRQDLKRHKQSTFLLPWSGLFSPPLTRIIPWQIILINFYYFQFAYFISWRKRAAHHWWRGEKRNFIPPQSPASSNKKFFLLSPVA